MFFLVIFIEFLPVHDELLTELTLKKQNPKASWDLPEETIITDRLPWNRVKKRISLRHLNHWLKDDNNFLRDYHKDDKR